MPLLLVQTCARPSDVEFMRAFISEGEVGVDKLCKNIHMAKRFMLDHGRMADLRNAIHRADILKHVVVYLRSIYGHLENKGAVIATELARISGDEKGECSDSPHFGDSETIADMAVGDHEDEEEVLPEIDFNSASGDLSSELSYSKPEPSLRAIHIQGTEENYPHP